MRRDKRTFINMRKFFKWSFIIFFSLLIIWIGYSWIVVSKYNPLPLQSCEIPTSHKEFRGAIHIHTSYSDGGGTPEEVLEAAKQVNLDFIIITDHDSMAAWELAQKRKNQRPLLLIGNEISTKAGHLLALCYPERRDAFPEKPQDAIDEVHRMGGLSVLAHPTRPKNPWRDMSVTGIDGMEVLNLESVFSAMSRLRIFLILPQGFINQRNAIASLVDFTPEGISLWDKLNKKQKAIGFCGADAHGPILAGFPSYEGELGIVNIHLVSNKSELGSLSENNIEKLLRSGAFYMAIDAIAVSKYVDFRLLTKDKKTHGLGEAVELAGEGCRLKFDAAAPAGSKVRLINDGTELMTFNTPHFDVSINKGGAYRVEIVIPGNLNPYGRDKTWIITNHIYIK